MLKAYLETAFSQVLDMIGFKDGEVKMHQDLARCGLVLNFRIFISDHSLYSRESLITDLKRLSELKIDNASKLIKHAAGTLDLSVQDLLNLVLIEQEKRLKNFVPVQTQRVETEIEELAGYMKQFMEDVETDFPKKFIQEEL